ncbi:hypothetical protein HYZ97_03840 [Candidatus Pacearchaeota archaeon]|nr:hypothetical protein [Candidatus Pacearchaeota archaeon]
MDVNKYQDRREVPTLYQGPINAIMPKMRKNGQVPATFAFRMVGILQGKEEWLKNYHDLGNTFVVPSIGERNGRFKVSNFERLAGIDEETPLTCRRLPVNYLKVKGEEFSRDTIGRDLTIEEARKNEVYLELCCGNKALLEMGVDRIFDEGKKFNYENMMGIFIPTEREIALEGAWCVDGLVGYGWSFALGGAVLDLGYGRLVGLASETLEQLEYILRNERNPAKLRKLLGIRE